jgi:cytochrome c oxidase subunit 2
VIHNYSIIPMRIQQDAMPGQDIPMWFKPIKKMETYVVCGQLCGEGHGSMTGTLEVIGKGAYEKWAAAESAAALDRNTPQKTDPLAAR